jgi:hypothetical protein
MIDPKAHPRLARFLTHTEFYRLVPYSFYLDSQIKSVEADIQDLDFEIIAAQIALASKKQMLGWLYDAREDALRDEGVA